MTTHATIVLGVILALAGGRLALGEAPDTDRVRVVLSSRDGTRRLSEEKPLTLGPARSTELPVVEIDLAQTRQSMLGLGASFEHATCENFARLPAAQREEVIRPASSFWTMARCGTTTTTTCRASS